MSSFSILLYRWTDSNCKWPIWVRFTKVGFLFFHSQISIHTHTICIIHDFFCHSTVKIRHDNSALLGSDWFLDRVEIAPSGGSARDKYTFLCERWLAKNRDDKQIERVLFEKVTLINSVGLSSSRLTMDFDLK